MYKIAKLRKSDLSTIYMYWNVYKPFLERYNSMAREESTFLIVWSGDKPIGHGGIWWKETPLIEDMFIGDQYQNKGIGTKLLKRLELYAKKNNYSYVKLFVEENIKAEKLYQKQGYKFTGEINNKGEREYCKLLN